MRRSRRETECKMTSPCISNDYDSYYSYSMQEMSRGGFNGYSRVQQGTTGYDRYR